MLRALRCLAATGRSGECQVDRRFAAITAGFDVIGHLLIVGERGQGPERSSAEMWDEKRPCRRFAGADEPEAFGAWLNQFHGARLAIVISPSVLLPSTTMRQLGSVVCIEVTDGRLGKTDRKRIRSQENTMGLMVP